MDVQRLSAHPKVLQAQGKVALCVGRVYAFEQADNQVSLGNAVLPARPRSAPSWIPSSPAAS